MFQDAVGLKSEQIKNTVERGAVKKFAESIDDVHPLYVDESYGKESRFGKNIAPPTFPRTFDYGTIKDLHLPNVGLIHGEQRYHYKRPLLVGEDVYCYAEVKSYTEKDGKSGSMGFLTLANNGVDESGEIVFESTSTVIISETVRRKLSV
ncbi:MaoC family dehydratase N-terminal domain-containing protein [Geomicrobium sp. JCM 19038]|uniref:MaoC family dehydratase N-terminal domain-containing protein n=1 Tax=Geomicrobium sp. JCM 19038 TaxID=1460635 RepID=UPI00045F1C30|nr:MaoC family dehydratase N-terminal domain-containing protein [Geomicrobium sp. JCM 19038]GAK07121.1 hypothetical protein JCM19038_841 [Geomicrobium sp. JCM 19038]